MSNKQDMTMKLMAYADGELTAAEQAEMEQALARSPELAAELAEIKNVSLFAVAAFEVPAEVKVDVYANVMARIAAEAPVQASAWARFQAWLGEVFRFERPMALAGLAAAVIAVVLGALALGASGTGNGVVDAPAESMANSTPGQRRGMEGEHKANGRNTAFVETWEVAKGKVVVDVNKEDPDQPMVLWHVIDGESTAAQPKGL